MTRLWLLQPCRTGVAVAVAVAVVAELGVGYNLEDPRLHRGEADKVYHSIAARLHLETVAATPGAASTYRCP